MGIKELTATLREQAPDAVRCLASPSELEGFLCLIDAPILIHQFAYAAHNETNAVQVEDAVHAYVQQLRWLGAAPLLVFDGPCKLEAKKACAARRAAARCSQLQRSAKKRKAVEDLLQPVAPGEEPLNEETGAAWLLELANATAVATKATKSDYKVTEHTVEEVKRVLRARGLPFLESPDEGERACARAARMLWEPLQGKVVVVSQDMDCLPFGAPLMLRNLSLGAVRALAEGEDAFRGLSPQNAPFWVDAQKSLEGLRLSSAQFVDFCILCGSDFTTGTLPRVGRKTALKLLRDHASIENIIQELSPAPDVLSAFEFAAARDVFGLPLDWDLGMLLALARALLWRPDKPGEGIPLGAEPPAFAPPPDDDTPPSSSTDLATAS